MAVLKGFLTLKLIKTDHRTRLHRETLNDHESEAIKSIYEGKDVFTWLPTGYGKSLRYQLLLFLLDFKLGRTRAIATEWSVALVISPLVSLMVDQVCSL